MRHVLITLLCFMSVGAWAQDKQLVILHTNDTHSTIMPLNPNLSDKKVAGRGGYLRRMEFLRQQREQTPDLLLFDSGDFSQGSPYYTLFKGDVEVGLMNSMHYDAVTIGNHEFDYGLDNMARLFRMAEFPVVCANYDFTGTPLEKLVKPYVIIKRKGVRIGVFGLCPPLEGLVDAHNCQGVKFLDPVAKANEIATLLKKREKCDLVICISHLGWEVSVYPDEKFLSLTEGCDLVLGGHTHTYMPTLEYAPDKNGKMIPVDQNGKHGVFIGKLILNLEK